jgi:DNA (cytosine-5)-methyltransferase 1
MKTVIDLFSGIGGFTLGMEWAGGWRTVQFVEREPFCQAVLRKHWPAVPIHDDITTFDGFRADAVVGGFPCQDISLAGKGAGLAGGRSGLWWEMHRVIAQARPRWCIIENVPALRSRGLDTVLRSLDSIGFDAEWHCLPAAAIGARHRRDRVWIVAYAKSSRWAGGGGLRGVQAGEESDAASSREAVSHAIRHGLERRIEAWAAAGAAGRSGNAGGPGWWAIEPDVGRVADGVPARTHRLRALGNAIVPQIAQIITETLNDVDTD